MNTILIIEDDQAMLRGLIDNFEHSKYKVLSATNGEKGLELALNKKPDLIILDIMIPHINGYEVCRRIRENNCDIPIIMLTAKDDESDIVLGLNLGADDYVTKPFGIRELLARTAAFLRRKQKDDFALYKFGDCKLDVPGRKFTKRNNEIKLTPKEFDLLQLFTSRPGRVFSRDEILNRVWGEDCFITTRSVDRCVTTLRNKIESKSHSQKFIHTVREVGYKFLPPHDDNE